MNYPVWHLGFPGGMLIAAVAILHVFISHFAVGGGAYLVLTERRAYRRDDADLLAYVRHHSKFFALLTVVFGAVSGVGIWFTIGLVSPEATSSLIHTFVWAWAIEWVFFFVEIAAALIYAYQWDRLDRATHLTIGWIYFVAAWASLAVINGIITYMLTPGRWLQTKNFWDGLLNPTYLPSLLIRSAMAIALAGMFGLVTALVSPARQRLVRWAGTWLLVGAVLLLPLGWWYDLRLPKAAHIYLAGLIPTVRFVAGTGIVLTLLVVLLTIVFAVWRPRLMNAALVGLMLIFGLAMMGSGEYVREVSRKPFAIGGYIYANDVRAGQIEAISSAGAEQFSPWLSRAGDDPLHRGRELFVAECAACHSVGGYRAIGSRVSGWDEAFAREMLLHLPLIRGTMPPFAGNGQDRAALAHYLVSVAAVPPPVAKDALGRQAFATRCALCHTLDGQRRPLSLSGSDPETIEGLIGSLSDISSDMPPFTGSDAERHALAVFLAGGSGK